MEEILIHPAYFGPVSQFVALGKAEKVFLKMKTIIRNKPIETGCISMIPTGNYY